MSKKIVLSLFTSFLLLSACNSTTVEEKVSMVDESKAEEVSKNEDISSKDTSNQETTAEESLEITGPVITSKEFIFSELGKITNPLDSHKYEEIIGYNPVKDYYLIREKDRIQDDVEGVITNFVLSEIYSDSEVVDVSLHGIKQWYQNGYTYKLFDTDPYDHGYMDAERGMEFEQADNLVKKEFYVEETGETQLLYEEGTLQNDTDLQNEVGEFEFHYLQPVDFNFEDVELKNEIFDATIHSASYTHGTLEIDVEILSNEDVEIDVNVFLPYNDMKQSYANVNVLKDIPLKETISVDGVDNLYLEDRIIISLGEEYLIIDFDKEGYKLGNELNRNTVFTDSLNLLGLASIQYEIFPEENSDGSEFEVNIGYLSGTDYEEDTSLSYTTKDLTGNISIPEKVRSLKLELIQDSSIMMPTATFNMNLKEPDLTATLTPIK